MKRRHFFSRFFSSVNSGQYPALPYILLKLFKISHRCKVARCAYAPFLGLKLQKLDFRDRIKADTLDALLLLKANAEHIDKLA